MYAVWIWTWVRPLMSMMRHKNVALTASQDLQVDLAESTIAARLELRNSQNLLGCAKYLMLLSCRWLSNVQSCSVHLVHLEKLPMFQLLSKSHGWSRAKDHLTKLQQRSSVLNSGQPWCEVVDASASLSCAIPVCCRRGHWLQIWICLKFEQSISSLVCSDLECLESMLKSSTQRFKHFNSAFLMFFWHLLPTWATRQRGAHSAAPRPSNELCCCICAPSTSTSTRLFLCFGGHRSLQIR